MHLKCLFVNSEGCNVMSNKQTRIIYVKMQFNDDLKLHSVESKLHFVPIIADYCLQMPLTYLTFGHEDNST